MLVELVAQRLQRRVVEWAAATFEGCDPLATFGDARLVDAAGRRPSYEGFEVRRCARQVTRQSAGQAATVVEQAVVRRRRDRIPAGVAQLGFA